MVVAKNKALTKKKYNQNETNEKNVYANMHSSDPETSDRLLYILFLFEIKNTANSSLYMNGKSVPSPLPFQKEVSAVMRHALHVTTCICFYSGSTCLIEKPLTVINFTTYMIAKYCAH